MLEVMTPEQTARYIEITNPDFIAPAFQMMISPSTDMPSNLNLIG